MTGPEDLRARFAAHATADLVTGHAPGLLALHGVGTGTAALLLAAAGDHPERLRSEAAWAHLCAAAPIPASSGKTSRHRLNPGRQAYSEPSDPRPLRRRGSESLQVAGSGPDAAQVSGM